MGYQLEYSKIKCAEVTFYKKKGSNSFNQRSCLEALSDFELVWTCQKTSAVK